MKSLTIVSCLLLWLASLAVAQSSDWEVVRSVPVGKAIKVTLKGRPTFGHCAFEEVTDDELFCYSRMSGEWQFERKEIRAIYVARDAKLAGFIIGATTGATDGAANTSNGLSRGSNAIIGGLLLGGIGVAIGAAVGPFFNGKAIYRSDTRHPARPRHPSSSGPGKDPKPDASVLDIKPEVTRP